MSLITDISNGLQAKKRALQKHELAMGSSEASQEYSKYMTVLDSDFKKLLNNHQIQTSDYNALNKAVFIGRVSSGKRLKHNLTLFINYATSHINYYKNKRYPGPLTKATDSTNTAYLRGKETQDYKNMTEKQRQHDNIDVTAAKAYSKDLQDKTMSLSYINNDIYDNLVYKYQISVNAWRQIPVKWLPVEGHDVINLVNRGITGLDKVHARIEERYARLPHVGGDESATSSSSNVVYTHAKLVQHAKDSNSVATDNQSQLKHNISSAVSSEDANASNKSKQGFFGKVKNAFKSLKEPYNANDVSSNSASSLNHSVEAKSASVNSYSASSVASSSSSESSLQARVASLSNSRAKEDSSKASESSSSSSEIKQSVSSHMSFGLRTNASVKSSSVSSTAHSSSSSDNTNALRQMFNNAKQQRPTANSVSIHETSSASVDKASVSLSNSVSASKSTEHSLSVSASNSISASTSASYTKSKANSTKASISNSKSVASSTSASLSISSSESASASSKADSQSVDNARIRSALRESAKVAHPQSSSESYSASSVNISSKSSSTNSSSSFNIEKSSNEEEYSQRLKDLFMTQSNGNSMVKGSNSNMPKSNNHKIQFHSVNPSANANNNSIKINRNANNSLGATSPSSSAQTPQSLGNSLLNEIVSATRHFGSLSNADRINDINTVSNREMTISNLKTKVSTMANESAKKIKATEKQGKENTRQASLSADRGYSASSASASKSADKAVASTQHSDKAYYDGLMDRQRSNYQSQANQANQETSQSASSSAQDAYKTLSNSASYSAEQSASHVANSYSKKIDSKNDTIDKLKAELTNMSNKAKNYENRVKKIDAIIGK